MHLFPMWTYPLVHAYPQLLLLEQPRQLLRYLRSRTYRRWFHMKLNEHVRLVGSLTPGQQMMLVALSERLSPQEFATSFLLRVERAQTEAEVLH